MKANYNKSSIMSNAWAMVRTLGYSFSEALKTAWANAKFTIKAKAQIVHFVFKKIDGSIREAFGTLKESLLPPTTHDRRDNPSIQIYFDTEKNEWRCFKRHNLIAVY